MVFKNYIGGLINIMLERIKEGLTKQNILTSWGETNNK